MAVGDSNPTDPWFGCLGLLLVIAASLAGVLAGVLL